MTNLQKDGGWCRVNPLVDSKIQNYCRLPYHNHPKGCPNWGHRASCPPKAPLLTEVLDCSQSLWCVYNRFDLGMHIERMKAKHPDWTIHQLRCVLYWQGTARKQLRHRIERFRSKYPDQFIVACPEGAGANLTQMMQEAGIPVKWPVGQYVYQAVVAGQLINAQHKGLATRGARTGL